VGTCLHKLIVVCLNEPMRRAEGLLEHPVWTFVGLSTVRRAVAMPADSKDNRGARYYCRQRASGC
jgi:hypothetical protein